MISKRKSQIEIMGLMFIILLLLFFFMIYFSISSRTSVPEVNPIEETLLKTLTSQSIKTLLSTDIISSDGTISFSQVISDCATGPSLYLLYNEGDTLIPKDSCNFTFLFLNDSLPKLLYPYDYDLTIFKKYDENREAIMEISSKENCRERLASYVQPLSLWPDPSTLIIQLSICK